MMEQPAPESKIAFTVLFSILTFTVTVSSVSTPLIDAGSSSQL